MISVIEINHCNRPRENNSIKMPLESKRRSTSQRLTVVFIAGWIVFGFILSRYTKITFSAGYETLEMKDQYYMPSYWGSHECSRSSSPCKDIPDYFKGLIYQVCHGYQISLEIIFEKSVTANHTWNVTVKSAPSCPNDYMIRFIKSSPFNFELRNLVRSHIRNQRSKYNRTLFLIGTVPDEDSRKNQLLDEMKRFNDFIVGDFIDSYRNVTRKSFTAYR